jgi:hypothetical protein
LLCNIPLHGYLPKIKGNLVQYLWTNYI